MNNHSEQQPFKLEYYMFDWDDNILHMPTKIHLEKREGDQWRALDVSTAEFARIRHDTKTYRPLENDWNKAFINFDDVSQQGEATFMEDTIKALEPVLSGDDDGAPSFHRFKMALIEARLFAIITARSLAPNSIREAVAYFVDKVLNAGEKQLMMENLRRYQDEFGASGEALSDEELLNRYLSINRYHGVSSPEFQKLTGLDEATAEQPELAKRAAVRDFVEHILGLVRLQGASYPISVGFSDDDPNNLQAIEEFLREELSKEFPEIKFVVYDTSDPELPSGRKMVIRQES